VSGDEESCSCTDDEACEVCAISEFDPQLTAIGLRLMLAALDEDFDGMSRAFEEIDECPHCERYVLLTVLRAVFRYGGPGLGEVLRQELLEILDLVEELEEEAQG